MSNLFPSTNWSSGASIYEVNIRQYTSEGNFAAFRKHLPRLKDMGVKILWLMPITPISVAIRQGTLGSYYACSSYTDINPEYGNLSDFKELVDEAHRLNFKIIIDWVANHTGWDHHWTKEHPEYYIRDVQSNFTERNGWHDVIDLNYDNREMRQAMISAMQFWVKEYDIDGFRCDMAHLVTLDFWKEARPACETIKPLFWLAECEVVEYHDVFDVTYAWSWMHATENMLKGSGSMNDVRNVLHGYTQYPKDSAKLFFTANHDENSWNGTEYEKYGYAAKALAVFTCTWQGMPLIYNGQELPNFKRLKFFDKDQIDWKEPVELHDFYKTLLHLHQTSAIVKGETFILPVENDGLMAFFRRNKEEVVLVLLNISENNKLRVTVDHEWLAGRFKGVFSELSYSFQRKEVFELQSGEYLVYSKING